MKKSIFSWICFFLGLCLLTGCGSVELEDTHSRVLTDGAGRQVSLPAQVESLVCVGVGALRYTCYMGAADRVVGVEDYEKKGGFDRLYNYVNFEKFRQLPVIGTNGQPLAEEIIALSPDVIVMSKFASVEADALQSQTGIPVVVIPGSDTLLDEGTYETLSVLGELLRLESRAEQLKSYLLGLQADLHNRTKDIAPEDKPRVYVAGVSYKGHHGMEGTEAGYGPLDLIHANNLADSTGRTGAFTVDDEQILSWDPDLILVDFNGLGLILADYRDNPDFYRALTAVNDGRVYSQISFRSFATNLDTALANAYYAASVIYPQAFADVDPQEKAREIFEMLLGTDPYDQLKEAGYEFRSIEIAR